MITILLIIFVFNFVPLLLLAFFYFKSFKPKNSVEPISKPVTIIIACYNEGQFIERKLTELLDTDEWIEGSELIVVSNGSTDNTAEVLEKYLGDKRLKIFLFEKRIGKIQSINFASAIAQNEIIVFSDSRQKIKKNSVKNLVAGFSNPEVALVTSVICDSEIKPSFIRKCIHLVSYSESKAGICCSVHGALYAIRKEFLTSIPGNIIFDDLYMNVHVISKNQKVICEPNSVIYDLSFETYYVRERIERLTRGLLLFFFNHLKLILKMKPLAMLIFIWHKYGKIINTILLLCLLMIVLVQKLESYGWQLYLLIFLVAIGLVNKKTRMIFDFIIYQTVSLIKYLFKINRSVDWEKLSIYKNSSSVRKN